MAIILGILLKQRMQQANIQALTQKMIGIYLPKMNSTNSANGKEGKLGYRIPLSVALQAALIAQLTELQMQVL